MILLAQLQEQKRELQKKRLRLTASDENESYQITLLKEKVY